MKKTNWLYGILGLAACGVAGLSSHAAVEPFRGGEAVLDEDGMSEIRVARLRDLNFDQDLSQLARAEDRYRGGGGGGAALSERSRIRLPLRRILDLKERRR